MIEAFIHGKLSNQQENMEDVLTSCVFGSLRLIPPHKGLLPFLSMCQSLDGNSKPLLELANLESGHEDVEYQFWPMFSNVGCHSCEPDLVLTVQSTMQLILVEAKLYSVKSSVADDGLMPFDQLAREWDNLVRVAESKNLKPTLVYLTADANMPRHTIQESIDEFVSKRPHLDPPNICWLSWQHLLKIPLDDLGVLQRLGLILRQIDLLPFSGWRPTSSVPKYEFNASPIAFAWPTSQLPLASGWNFPGDQ